MGYAHGFKWDDDSIKKSIFEVMQITNIDTMPSHSQMDSILGNTSLSGAISKHGGSQFWASKLGLEMLQSETKIGKELEDFTYLEIENKLGLSCEQMKPRYPYDVLVNGCVKIDVKVSNIVQSYGSNYFTFNLEKSNPTCDIYVAHCLDKDRTIKKSYIIPSSVLKGKTQLSVGEKSSPMYDKFIDRWDIITDYSEFFQRV